MKAVFSILLLFFTMTFTANAVTRGDVKIIEASENIRSLSQMIVKNYLLYYANPEKIEITERLHKSLDTLSDNFRTIAITTKDTDTKNILEFLAYSRDQIEQIFNEKADKERAALMLDYSETLLEGADSISDAYQYDFSEEEKMLMVTKKIEYLLERITKYYIALHSGFDSSTNKDQIAVAIEKLEDNLDIMNFYNYPYKIRKKRAKINTSWKETKMFFTKPGDIFIPRLMIISVDYLENMVDEIAIYHSKNQ
jgi:hypothetical protein